MGRGCGDVLTSILKLWEDLAFPSGLNGIPAAKESDEEPSIRAAELEDPLKAAVRQLYALFLLPVCLLRD